jgi:phospholipase D1/2
VADPLSDALLELWEGTAKNNTEIFQEVFHTVPSDRVKTWSEYKVRFFSFLCWVQEMVVLNLD